MSAATFPLPAAPRMELRLALLAATESCWIYAVVLTFGMIAGFPRQVSPLGIFLVYWIGLWVGRRLPRSHYPWRVLQLLTVLLAVGAVLLGLRVGMYLDLPLTDWSWLGNYFARLPTFFQHLVSEDISILAMVFAYIRGLDFAQRPLTLWVVGYRFRLGIIVFFAMALLAAFTVRVDFAATLFLYFALSLLAISLARIEEVGQERPLGWRWGAVLVAAILGTLLLGWVVSQFLTLDVVTAVLKLLSPLLLALGIMIAILVVPFLYVLDFLLRLVLPIFDFIGRVLRDLLPEVDLTGRSPFEGADELTRQAEAIMPILRQMGVIVLVLLIGFLIARALRRRVEWREKEEFEREALEADDGAALSRQKRATNARPLPREIHAENVRRIYVALLGRADALGLTRRDAETPLEFLPRLVARFPQVEAGLREITDAYVAVHYAQLPATDAQVRALRGVWQNVKAGMTPDEASKKVRAKTNG